MTNLAIDGRTVKIMMVEDEIPLSVPRFSAELMPVGCTL